MAGCRDRNMGFCRTGFEHTGLSFLGERDGLTNAMGFRTLWRAWGLMTNGVRAPQHLVKHVCLPNNDKLLTLAKQA